MVYKNPRRTLEGRPEKITVNEVEYSFVINQRDRNSAIYKSGDTFLRIGKRETINAQLALHTQMESTGFPVPKLLGSGEIDGQYYFTEKSLGDNHIGQLFSNDMQEKAEVSPDRFEEFLLVVEKFAEAQLHTGSETRDYEDFANGIHLHELCVEMPEHADRLRARFEMVKDSSAELPFVLTHGDLNPHNMYPLGVIDFENSFYAPYGYDPVSAITHINYLPDSTNYEFYAGYRFTPEQKKTYFEKLDALSVENSLPPLSQFEEDFEFCRAVWLAVRIPHTPMLQKFRYDLLISKFLND